MKKLFSLLFTCAFVVTLSAQNFIKFDATDKNGVKALNGLAHRTGASMIEILVPADFDVSNVTVDHAIAETDQITTNPFPTNFTTPQVISVKGASSTKNWNVTFKKAKAATLPLDITFSETNLSSDWSATTEGWASGCIDPNQNKVVRFGNVTATFVVAFKSAAETIKYSINGVGADWGAGVFDVYVSADGQSWTSQKKFDSSNPMPLGTLTEYNFKPSDDIRYVKWVYTNRVVNVTMNNISVTASTTGLSSDMAVNSKIYVNRAEIVLPDASDVAKVEVYNTIGMLVKSNVNPNGNISLSGLPKGIYIAKATILEGKSETIKFVVR